MSCEALLSCSVFVLAVVAVATFMVLLLCNIVFYSTWYLFLYSSTLLLSRLRERPDSCGQLNMDTKFNGLSSFDAVRFSRVNASISSGWDAAIRYPFVVLASILGYLRLEG